MTHEPPPLPIPLATLAYAPPPQNRRPGIMTAVGVVSIVLASVSLLMSVGGVFSNFAMLALSRMPMPTITPPSVSTPVNSSTATVTVDGIEVDPEGSADAMPLELRRKVVQAIDNTRPLNATRRKHVDLLLKYSGTKMFPSVTDATSVGEIRGKMSWGDTGPSIDYIYIPTGTIQITDRFATFRPSGKGELVQANAIGTPRSAPAPAMPMPFPFRIDPTAAILALCEAAVSLLIAIVLLIGGILLLRDSPAYLRLHWIYIVAKIPLVILAAVASWMTSSAMMSSMQSSMPPGSAPLPTINGFMIIPTIVMALVAMAYPISLIFIFATRTAKAYYNDVRGIRA